MSCLRPLALSLKLPVRRSVSGLGALPFLTFSFSECIIHRCPSPSAEQILIMPEAQNPSEGALGPQTRLLRFDAWLPHKLHITTTEPVSTPAPTLPRLYLRQARSRMEIPIGCFKHQRHCPIGYSTSLTLHLLPAIGQLWEVEPNVSVRSAGCGDTSSIGHALSAQIRRRRANMAIVNMRSRLW